MWNRFSRPNFSDWNSLRSPDWFINNFWTCGQICIILVSFERKMNPLYMCVKIKFQEKYQCDLFRRVGSLVFFFISLCLSLSLSLSVSPEMTLCVLLKGCWNPGTLSLSLPVFSFLHSCLSLLCLWIVRNSFLKIIILFLLFSDGDCDKPKHRHITQHSCWHWWHRFQ